MARGLRLDPGGVPMHVVQRGNNRAACFTCDHDFRLYLYYLRHAAVRFSCKVHAYVLMTNHVHLLLTPQERHAVSQLMQHVGRRYVRKFNETHDRTGTLWEGRFRSSIVDSERYFLACQRYIEHNPVRAGMLRNALDYPWSSRRHYAGRCRDPLVTEHECYLLLGSTAAERNEAYVELCEAEILRADIDSIRRCLNKGQPLGGPEFQARVHAHGTLMSHVGRRPRPDRMRDAATPRSQARLIA